jgi:predicted DsbA family dithiol-disulfide isomerase
MLQARLYLDYIDPGSFLMDRRIEAVSAGLGVRVQRLPWEARPPSLPPLDPLDEGWVAYWSEMAAEAAKSTLELRSPALIPRTRKAHELALHAREKGLFDKVHRALMAAFHLEGRDLGRVDVLVEVGCAAGLDRSETKAVLDVDRFAASVEEMRTRGEGAGVRGVPTLVFGDRMLEGVHPEETLREFLGGTGTT